MATSTLEKYVECPVCFNLLQGPTHQPLALGCMHTLCKDCYLQIKSKKRVTCPLCNAISDVSRVKPDFRTESLVDDYLQESKDDPCQTSPSCGICQKSSNVAIELCSKCDVALCKCCAKCHKADCSGKEPGMQAENARHMTEMKQQLQSMKDITEDRINQLQRKLRKLDKTERNALKKINAAEEKAIRDIKEHYENLRSEVEHAKDSLSQQLESEQEIESQRKIVIERHLRKVTCEVPDSMATRSGETVLDTVNQFLYSSPVLSEDQSHADFSVILLNGKPFDEATATQVDITAKHHPSGGNEISSYQNVVDQGLCPTAPVEEDILFCPQQPNQSQERKKRPKSATNKSRKLPISNETNRIRPFTAMPENPSMLPDQRLFKRLETPKMYSKDVAVTIDGVAYRLIKYRDELWCNTSSVLFHFTGNCELVKQIPMQGVTDVRSLVKINSDTFVVLDAGYQKQSVKLLDQQGGLIKTLLSGKFGDICFCNNILYALEQDQNVVIALEKKSRGVWEECKKIKLSNCSSKLDTMCIFEDHIFIASSSSHCVYIFNANGRLLGNHGQSGDDVKGANFGLLKYPKVCGRHSSGKVLVADCFNKRLQVLSLDGTWKVLNLGDVYGTTLDAILEKDKLFVLQFFDRSHHIVKYKPVTKQ